MMQVAPAQGNGSAAQDNTALVRIEVQLVGVTPLLMNAMSEAQLLAIRDKKKAPKNASKPIPREEAERKVHRLANGDPCIPIHALMSCLIGGGQFVRLDGKRQISTQKSSVLAGLMTIESTALPLINPATGKVATWEVDIQQGRNPNGGEAVCIIRPRFDAWMLELEITVDQQEISVNTIRDLHDIAGKRMGLGDFRPQRKGTFGRFRVERWEIVG